MGSSGTGRFGDYRSEREEECPKEIKHIKLEDVRTSQYFGKYNTLPQLKQKINIAFYDGRLTANTQDENLTIGNLPTKYNYLHSNCILVGSQYEGEVISSGMVPIPYIMVDLYER